MFTHTLLRTGDMFGNGRLAGSHIGKSVVAQSNESPMPACKTEKARKRPARKLKKRNAADPASRNQSKPRTCGDCQACCHVFPLAEPAKPARTWCKHACSGGCAIYAARSGICAEFECFWLQHPEIPERLRPDRLGFVYFERPNQVVYVSQAFEDAHRSEAANVLFEVLIENGYRVVITWEAEDDPWNLVLYAGAEPMEAELCDLSADEQRELTRIGRSVGTNQRVETGPPIPTSGQAIASPSTEVAAYGNP